MVAFWSGLPVIFGSAGVLLGYEARNRAERGAPHSGTALAALIIGIVAIAAGVNDAVARYKRTEIAASPEARPDDLADDLKTPARRFGV